MKIELTEIEKIQYVYDLLGMLACALILGAVCSFFVSFHSQAKAELSNWEKSVFFISLFVHSFYFYLFWSSSRFQKFRLNANWLFVSIFSTISCMILTWLVRDLKAGSFSAFSFESHSLDIFPFITGISTIGLAFFMFCFWVIGFIHRIAVGNADERISLNLLSKI